MEVASRSVHDEKALFDEDDVEEDEIVLGRNDNSKVTEETSKQRLLSLAKVKPEFEGLRISSSGHKIQDVRELMAVPVCDFFFVSKRISPNYLLNRSLSPLILPKALP